MARILDDSLEHLQIKTAHKWLDSAQVLTVQAGQIEFPV